MRPSAYQALPYLLKHAFCACLYSSPFNPLFSFEQAAILPFWLAGFSVALADLAGAASFDMHSFWAFLNSSPLSPLFALEHAPNLLCGLAAGASVEGAAEADMANMGKATIIAAIIFFTLKSFYDGWPPGGSRRRDNACAFIHVDDAAKFVCDRTMRVRTKRVPTMTRVQFPATFKSESA